ncbi:LytR/AlgR family response regulator transcription factor [Mucilaginibacter sp.]|uniref:LytR/AlgR family response regulator transcription factor n=1 Tax=Mucilaginibacter sp. TaxID=1882438 RepID=UPI0035BC7953
MINCLIADDEELAREIIQSHVSKLKTLNLVAVCANGMEVYEAIKKYQVDLLFLDIHMPKLTGIELLRTLKAPPPVIITTAYREFALEGYELNVVDYLLKPVSFERFLKAIEKYINIKLPVNTLPPPARDPPKNDDRAFLYVKADRKMVRLLIKDILYIEGLKDYVKVHTTGKPVVTYQTLIYLEEKLSADHFIRVHRSYIVSLHHITAYTASQIEVGKIMIPIGGSFVREVLERLAR